MFRRGRGSEPPGPEWKQRVGQVRQIVVDHGDPATIAARLDELERALDHAEHDRAHLEQAITSLNPERVTRELKAALRERPPVPGVPDDFTVATLRRRHDAVNELVNRREELTERIGTTVADLEALAARSVELAVGNRGVGSTLDVELERLHRDLTALQQAHDEIRDL
ncbi:MAG TPA: hypothetical protein VJM33_11510 [Microthrixaceae bacterium]|nr:hypothetical protein [Microthrixaceae bacterium]